MTRQEEAAAVFLESMSALVGSLPKVAEMATKEERAAVVAALRRTSNHGPMGLSLVNLDSIADAIERGEHRATENK
jgi:hypothetical protein